jgi:uncharacterized protein (DUF433 family)
VSGGLRVVIPLRHNRNLVGTRIAVYDVLDYLASGMTSAEIVDDLPELTKDHVRVAICFAAMRERRLATPA